MGADPVLREDAREEAGCRPGRPGPTLRLLSNLGTLEQSQSCCRPGLTHSPGSGGQVWAGPAGVCGAGARPCRLWGGLWARAKRIRPRHVPTSWPGPAALGKSTSLQAVFRSPPLSLKGDVTLSWVVPAAQPPLGQVCSPKPSGHSPKRASRVQVRSKASFLAGPGKGCRSLGDTHQLPTVPSSTAVGGGLCHLPAAHPLSFLHPQEWVGASLQPSRTRAQASGVPFPQGVPQPTGKAEAHRRSSRPRTPRRASSGAPEPGAPEADAAAARP